MRSTSSTPSAAQIPGTAARNPADECHPAGFAGHQACRPRKPNTESAWRVHGSVASFQPGAALARNYAEFGSAYRQGIDQVKAFAVFGLHRREHA